MSKYKFKITYRNEDEYGNYWGDKRYTVSMIAETLEQAKQKLDEIEKNEYRNHKHILDWEADEINNTKDEEIERLHQCIKADKENADEIIVEQTEEIERLNNIITELEKYLKEYDEIWNTKLLDTLKELKENSK